jgi:hypothetical protein
LIVDFGVGVVGAIGGGVQMLFAGCLAISLKRSAVMFANLRMADGSLHDHEMTRKVQNSKLRHGRKHADKRSGKTRCGTMLHARPASRDILPKSAGW